MEKEDEEEQEIEEEVIDAYEDFTWFNHNKNPDKPTQNARELDTYLVFYNHCRRTIQPGDQLYNYYGQRNNRCLFKTYGFTILDNKYDSYEFYVNRSLAFIMHNIKDYNKYDE